MGVYLGTNLLLTAFTAYYYGCKRVACLQNKSFHLFAFVLTLFASITAVVSGGCGLVWVERMKQSTLTDPSQLYLAQNYDPTYKSFVFFFIMSWGSEMVLHTIFAVKYWVASRKVA